MKRQLPRPRRTSIRQKVTACSPFRMVYPGSVAGKARFDRAARRAKEMSSQNRAVLYA
jgi:hypothetical protein